MLRKIALLLSAILLVGSVSAQGLYPNTAYQSGEKLVYTASYIMSGMWTDMAELSMEVSTMKTSQRDMYQIKCLGTTYSKWDNFFKVRDIYESYVDPSNSQPFLFKRMVDEGGYTKNVKAVFKRAANSANLTISRPASSPAQNVTAAASADTYDFVSILYALRNADLNKMKVGDSRTLKLLADKKFTAPIVPVKVVLRGTETVDTPYGPKKCYRLSVSLATENVLKGGEAANQIWLTADANRVPVKIEANIPVGALRIRLKSWQGLRNK